MIGPRLPIRGQNTSSELMYLEVSLLEVQSVPLSLTDNVNFNCKVKTLGFAKQYGDDKDHDKEP